MQPCILCQVHAQVALSTKNGASVKVGATQQQRKQHTPVFCANASSLVPMQLAMHIALCLHGLSPVLCMRLALLPSRRFPLLISEFAHTVTVQAADAPPLDDKRQLRATWRGIAAGSKLLREVLAPGESRTAQLTSFTFGVYRTFQAYISAASLLVHPFDAAKSLPDGMLVAIFRILTEGPVATIRHRLSTLKMWTAWAKELEPAEAQLRKTMHPSVRGAVGNKRIKLLHRIAESLSWPDCSLFDEMASGFKLTGYMQNTGVFSPDVKPATVSEEDFWLGAQHMRHALWDKVERQPEQEYSQELWDLTMEEASINKKWIDPGVPASRGAGEGIIELDEDKKNERPTQFPRIWFFRV